MRKSAYGVKLRQKQRQYQTSSSSILGIHVLIENWIFSVYQVLFLLLNDPQIEKIDYWCQKSATLWVCPLPKKKKQKKMGQPVAQHRQTSFFYLTSLASKKKVHMSRLVTCAPSEDSEQPGHPPSLIRVFAVRIKKAWVLSYPLSSQRRLIRLGGCPGWSESSLGAQSFCWFCHEAAHIKDSRLKGYSR